MSFFNIFCEFSNFGRFYTLTKYRQTVEFQLPFRMFQSKTALASSLRLCQIMYVLHTQPKANFFYHLHVAVDNLHVAVDNDVFAKLPRCCSVDHPFRYGHHDVCSSACRSASKAHRKYSLRLLWKIIS